MAGRVHSWRPKVPQLREVYHASFDHAYPMHTHEDWAVMLVDEGSVAYGLGRGEHHATPSGLTLLPPGVPHDGHSATEGSATASACSTSRPTGSRRASTGRPSMPPPSAPRARWSRPVGCTPRCGTRVTWLLAVRSLVLDHLGSPAPTTRDVPLARRMRFLLDDRLTESVTIAAAADELGVHPSHLVRVFSQTYGIAPHQYLVGRRVDLARHLLSGGHRPADAAAMAGFHDQAHLTRHFRRVLGVTPTAFVA